MSCSRISTFPLCFSVSVKAAFALLLPCLCALVIPAAEFIPFTHRGDTSNSETHTGLWFCVALGSAQEVVQMKTWLMPTTDSVTGGVALKMIMQPGSKGALTREQDTYPASVGITFYAKASRKIEVQIAQASASIGTQWQKIDFTWEDMGTTAAARKLGWQWVLKVKGPIQEKTWLIIDRLGVESPTFIKKPQLQVYKGKDKLLSSKDIFYGQKNIQKTINALKAQKKITLLTLGDSVTAGSQSRRGNYGVKDPKPHLFYNVFADHLRKSFQIDIKVKGFGHGGWTAKKALAVVDKEIVANAQAGDLVILEFGANDLGWAKVPHDVYKENLRQLIKRVQTKTDQIILMGPTMSNGMEKQADAVARILQELCTEESVAAVDITKMFVHQGGAFGWAWLANASHPSFSGHAVIGRMMAPLLTGKHITYPFN